MLSLLVDAGIACAAYQDDHLRNLTCRRIQCDEIWSFCHSKAKNVPEEHQGELGYGDIWTWTAIDAETKLVPSFCIGDRSAQTGYLFMKDLASRIKGKVQLTTDGHNAYLSAVERAFSADIDYAMLVKIYGDDAKDRRYSPGTFTGAEKRIVWGHPDEKYISTSHVERQNLTMRMNMRRFTRLTNGFSKKAENLVCAVALHFMHYNFVRSHQSLQGRTPAMAAGVADHCWTLDEVVMLIEAGETGNVNF